MKHLKSKSILESKKTVSKAEEAFLQMLKEVCAKFKLKANKVYPGTIMVNALYQLGDSSLSFDDVYTIEGYDPENEQYGAHPGNYELEDIIGSDAAIEFDKLNIPIFLPLGECIVNLIANKENCYFLAYNSDNPDQILFGYSLNRDNFMTDLF